MGDSRFMATPVAVGPLPLASLRSAISAAFAVRLGRIRG
jgi:hypothetical protein